MAFFIGVFMIKVRIEGYQSISSPIELEIDGYTVIQGESNRGKSSILRAIKALLINESGSDFITVGKSECRVKIEKDGLTVEWIKNKKGAIYIINGVEYKKVNKNVPDEVLKLGLFELVTNDKKRYWPQIQDQMDPPFILGEASPSTTAELIGSNEETLIVSKAIRLAKEEVSLNKTKSSLLQTQVEAARSYYLKLYEDSVSLEQSYLLLNDSRNQKLKLKSDLENIEDIQSRYILAKKVLDATDSICGVVFEEPLDPGHLGIYEGLLARYNYEKKICDLDYTSEDVEPPQVEDFVKKLEIYNDLKNRHSQVSSLLESLSVLEGLTIADFNTEVATNYARLMKLRSLYLEELKKEEILTKEEISLRSKKDVLSSEIRRLEVAMQGIDVCPTCGQEVNTEILMGCLK